MARENAAIPCIDKKLGRGVGALAAGENSLGDSHLMTMPQTGLSFAQSFCRRPGASLTIMGVWGAVQVGNTGWPTDERQPANLTIDLAALLAHVERVLSVVRGGTAFSACA